MKIGCLLCIPPEVSSAPGIKKVFAYLSRKIRKCWPTKCPHCGVRHLWKDGIGKRKTIPTVQRYRCPSCGKRFCDRTSTPFFRKRLPEPLHLASIALFYAPGFNVSLRAVSRASNTSHTTIMRFIRSVRFISPKKTPTTEVGGIWIADEKVVRVKGKKMFEWEVIDPQGRVLSRVLSPRRRALEAEYLLWKAVKEFGEPSTLMTNGNKAYKRAITILGLKCRHLVVTHEKEFVSQEGATTNPLEGRWSRINPKLLTHRGFKKWENASHYLEELGKTTWLRNNRILEALGVPSTKITTTCLHPPQTSLLIAPAPLLGH